MSWKFAVLSSFAVIVAAAQPAGASADIAAQPAGARCDGTWHVLKTPTQRSHNTRFAAVDAVSATDAWAVGDDTGRRGLVARAEHWDGSAWTVVKTATPKGATEAYFTAVSAVSRDDVYAVGAYRDGQGVTLALAEHWNGTKWKVMSTGILGVDTEALAVTAIAGSDVWLVGRRGGVVYVTMTAHWDGTKWKSVPSPNQPKSENNWLTAVSASGPDDVWATGNWTGNSWSSGLAEHWDGAAWKLVSTKPAFNLPANATIATNDAWSAGIDENGNGVAVEHWNGTSWSAVSAPSGSEVAVGGMGAAASDDVWLFASTYAAQRTILAEHWDGFSWTVIPTENPDVNALNIGGMSLTADGSVAFGVATTWKTGTSKARTLVEKWC